MTGTPFGGVYPGVGGRDDPTRPGDLRPVLREAGVGCDNASPDSVCQEV